MDQNTVYDDPLGVGTPPIDGTAYSAREGAQDVNGNARRVWLAGIGVAATACDVAADQFDRFVQRGQRVRQDMQERADEIRRNNTGTRGRMRDYFRQTMDAFLDGVNVPNKTDVDTINVKLNILTRKIDDLQIQSSV